MPVAFQKRLRRSAWLKFGVISVDVVSIAAAFALAFALREWLPIEGTTPTAEQDHLMLGAMAVPPVAGRLRSLPPVQDSAHPEPAPGVQAGGQRCRIGVLGTVFLGTMLKLEVTRSWLLLCLRRAWLPSCSAGSACDAPSLTPAAAVG